jgi:hypothetical protein
MQGFLIAHPAVRELQFVRRGCGAFRVNAAYRNVWLMYVATCWTCAADRVPGYSFGITVPEAVKTPYALFIAAAIATVGVLPVARPAQADTTSTIILAAAAGAIIGSLFTDSNNQPYYVNNGRHVYVSQNTASYYRAHGNTQHRGAQRDGQQHNAQQRR